MKSADALIKSISLLAFLAMAAYLGVYIFNRVVDPVQTALVVTASVSDSSPMSGLVVRDELVIRSNEQYIDVVAANGAKVSAGEAVAVAYGSEEALERASRLRTLSEEIEEVSAALSQTDIVQVTGDREQSIFSAMTELSSSLRSGDLSGVETQENTLASLIFLTDAGSSATEEYLQELQADYDRLMQTSEGDTTEVTVGESGTFSTVLDGYEGLNPDYAGQLSPSGLREIIDADRVVESNSIGKLITSYDWYYAAIVSEQDARTMVAGSTVKLSFGRYYDGELNAEIELVGQAEGSEQVVLFRIEKGLVDMLAVRAVSAELIYEEYTGLRVPLRGLYRYYAGYMWDADAQTLSEGGTVTLRLGDGVYEATVSEIGSASAVGDLPEGVEAGSEEDDRPRRRLVVFCWPWEEDAGPPDSSAGGGTVTVSDSGEALAVTNYYDYRTVIEGREDLPDSDPDKWNVPDRLCVFTMTGMQAERKLVELVYAGEEYCLLSSSGDDALREGNEVIVQADGLYNGRVFQ